MQRGVGLRIEIEKANALPGGGERRAKIHGGRRLPDAPFLIQNRNRPHRQPPCRISIRRRSR
jgi:hypothetical protein